MKVSDLIAILQTFPPDTQVAAMDQASTLAVVYKGGVTLEEADPEFGPLMTLGSGGDRSYVHSDQPYVCISGGAFTQHGWVDRGDE